MCDFEINLRKSVKKYFVGCNLKECYFHYIKNLWSKAKKIGICRKKYINKTKILIFGLKLLTLIKPNKQKEFFDEIELYCNNGNTEEKNLYSLYIKYFRKIWLNSNYIKFALCIYILS